MRLFLTTAVCALALVQACSGGAARSLRHVASLVPSMEERRAGAVPRRGEPDVAGVARNDAQLFVSKSQKAKIGQFPWMVSIVVDDSWFCSGSIIDKTWVLTAGQCVDGAAAFSLTAGSLAPSDGTEYTVQVVTATKAFRHPDFNPLFSDNDIGLIQPTKAFALSTDVAAVRLPSYSMAMDMMVGKTATISGWGLDEDTQAISQDLMYTTLLIDDGQTCYKSFGNTWIPNKVCVDTSKDKQSGCQSDSGAPLVVQEADNKWTVIGIMSFYQSCTAGLPIAFTRVASFLEYIETTSTLKARDY